MTGNAEVFEGALQVRVLSSTGAVLAKAPVSASCGTGCRGLYSAFFASRSASSSWEPWSSRRLAGRGPATKVRVPVVLAPG